VIPFIVRTYQGESTYVKFEYQYSLSLQIGSFLIFGVLSSYPTYLIQRREELLSAKRYIFFMVAFTMLLSIVMRSFNGYQSSNILLMVTVVIISSFYSVHNKALGRPKFSQFIDVLLPVSILLLIISKYTYYGLIIGIIPLVISSIGAFKARFLFRHLKVFLIAFIIQLIPQVIRILAPAMYTLAETDRMFLALRIFSVGILLHQFFATYYFRKILDDYSFYDYCKIAVISALGGLFFYILSRLSFLNRYMLTDETISFGEVGMYTFYVFLWSMLSLLELKLHYMGLHRKVLESVSTYLSFVLSGLVLLFSESLMIAIIMLMLAFSVNLLKILNENIAFK
jgi:hypothetical protein